MSGKTWTSQYFVTGMSLAEGLGTRNMVEGEGGKVDSFLMPLKLHNLRVSLEVIFGWDAWM